MEMQNYLIDKLLRIKDGCGYVDLKINLIFNKLKHFFQVCGKCYLYEINIKCIHVFKFFHLIVSHQNEINSIETIEQVASIVLLKDL